MHTGCRGDQDKSASQPARFSYEQEQTTYCAKGYTDHREATTAVIAVTCALPDIAFEHARLRRGGGADHVVEAMFVAEAWSNDSAVKSTYARSRSSKDGRDAEDQVDLEIRQYCKARVCSSWGSQALQKPSTAGSASSG